MTIENSAPELPQATAKLLDSLPQLIGAVDRFIIDETGEKTPFIVVAFSAGRAVHATNITPVSVAWDALRDLVKNLDT